jgi:cytochrome P450/NADPH-cytochrome P450 reductase
LVSSSYNGLPPANAKEFCRWLGDPPADQRADGCRVHGVRLRNTEWATTYQAVPILLDTKLEELGARRIHPRGEATYVPTFDAAYRAWHDTLWSDLATAFDLRGDRGGVRHQRVEAEYHHREPAEDQSCDHVVRGCTGCRTSQSRAGHGARRVALERSTRHVEVALPAV